MTILLVGLNHRTAPVELREQLSLAGCGLGMALDELRALASSDDTLHECAILSTCNRLEVIAVAPEADRGVEIIEGFLAHLQGIGLDGLKPHLYMKRGADVVEHLMRVACGLDSMILGETQILGQVASAYREAQTADTAGPMLSQLFAKAIHTGKRAHTETTISRYISSISHAAAKLAAERIGDLAQANVLILGAGEMAELAGQALKMRGVENITCMNRTYTRAEALAEQIGGQALGWYHLHDALIRADIVITATGAPHTVLFAHDVEAALPLRDIRPLLIFDIAVPRDVEDLAGKLPGVELFDIDDLQSTLDEHLAQRQGAVPHVEAIIAEEQRVFLDWLHSREVAPVISDLHRQVLAMVEVEVARALNKLNGLSPEEQKVIEQLGCRIANKLLHEPTVRLKASAAEGNGSRYAHTIRELFALDGELATYAGD